MAFSDLQLSLLGATSFVIFYTVLGSNSSALLLISAFVLLGLSLVWLGPAAADVHEIAGPHLRGLGIGIYFFTVNIAAYGIGANVIGKLNDWLGAVTNPPAMRYSLLICPIACLFAALLLWMGSRRLTREAIKSQHCRPSSPRP